ncbi:hypothetical protein ABKV19_009333 [Rosa sericea]
MSLNLFPDEADKWRQDQMTILWTVINQDTKLQGKGICLLMTPLLPILDLFMVLLKLCHLGKLYGRCLLLVIRASPSFTMLFDYQV